MRKSSFAAQLDKNSCIWNQQFVRYVPNIFPSRKIYCRSQSWGINNEFFQLKRCQIIVKPGNELIY